MTVFRSRVLWLSGLFTWIPAVLLIAAACAPAGTRTAAIEPPATSTRRSVVESTPTRAATGTLAPTDVWAALQDRTPHAYLSPQPEPLPSALDGLYAKLDQSLPQWWKCLRCADYRPAGGIWKLQFEHGVMRILYDVTGWRSLASFTVVQDRLSVFNDPYCPRTVGQYHWRVVDGQLHLELIEDNCAFNLRAQNLTEQTWTACPNASEPGCLEASGPPAVTPAADPPVSVQVYGGDSRFFARPPDLMVFANTADTGAPEGVRVAYDPGAIGYGLYRILWWNGNWIEAESELPVQAMGVQILGEPLIGWARVLFDGVEVWRGDTSEIWVRGDRSGGYIEVSGFEPGTHQLRVESLDFDHRPVTLMGFGYSYTGGVDVDGP